MLNRRILRIKAFKVLYSSMVVGNVPLSVAEGQLDASCEATRDLYLMMLATVVPLRNIAIERAENAKRKFNPTPEEKNPNMKFAENAVSKLFEDDPDFAKAIKKRKIDWEEYDMFLKKVYSSILGREYFAKYMSAPGSSLREDCKLFVKIFEREFVDSEDLEQILETLSIYWNDDLAYALTWCCKTMESIAKGERWSMPELYQSDMNPQDKPQSDKKFVHKLLQSALGGLDRYLDMISGAVANWEQDRLVSTDMALIVMGLAEVAAFPEIPVRIIINEYVEISKFYGTPKSSAFVNGMLDHLIQKMADEGALKSR